MTSIGEIALRLHYTGNQDLHIEISPCEAEALPEAGDGYVKAGDAIEFFSLEARNRLVAAFVLSRIEGDADDYAHMLFKQADDLWSAEIGHDDYASGRLLALASNTLDVIQSAADRIRAGGDVWNILHLLEAAIPHLEILDPDSLIDLCEVKSERTQGDFASGMLHMVIEKWYETRPILAVELHERIVQRLKPANATLLCNAIAPLAMSNFAKATELALQDVAAVDVARTSTGIRTAGRLLQIAVKPAAEESRLHRALLGAMESEQEDVRIAAFFAAASSLRLTKAFHETLMQLCQAENQEALAAVAQELWMRSEFYIDEPDVAQWLEPMAAFAPQDSRPLHYLDWVLEYFLRNAKLQPTILQLLGDWVIRHGKGGGLDKLASERLPKTFSKIGQDEALARSLVTSWLISDQKALPASIQAILYELSSAQSAKFDTTIVDQLEQSELLFLARRLLGYLHESRHMISLSLSLLDSKEPTVRIYPLLRTLLISEIGHDYPGVVITACKDMAQQSAEHRKFLLAIANQLEQAAIALDALPASKELMPPMRLRRLFATARAKQMNHAFQEASKKSIWRQIATEIPIKAGSGTFSYNKDSFGESIQLKEYSHSITLPRREVLDPIGSAIRRFQFRLAKRGEE